MIASSWRVVDSRREREYAGPMREGKTRRSLMRLAAAGVALSAGAAAAACAAPGAPSGEKPLALSGPATAKILLFNNPLFVGAQDAITSVLSTVDPQLKPDYILFPGQIAQFREKMVTMYSGGDIPDAQWVHPSITSLSRSEER